MEGRTTYSFVDVGDVDVQEILCEMKDPVVENHSEENWMQHRQGADGCPTLKDEFEWFEVDLVLVYMTKK